jgi:3-dehydroquinate synthase
MVGDLAGFVAATWMRGVPIVQCPTTLEAMIDASVGGKTAVNLPAGKNLVGAIHQPALVCADTHTLATLPDRDFRAGLAESVKHAVIADESLLNWQEQHAPAIVSREPGTLQELIRRNCQIKAAAVAGDERETAAEGVGRAALNFGHTIGHALEAESRYELRHGEAVALGMVAEMELAVRLCQWGQDNQERVELLLEQFGLPLRAARPLDMTCVIGRLEHDKKASGKSVRFVLPGPGGTMQWVAGASQADIAASLRRLMDKPPAA